MVEYGFVHSPQYGQFWTAMFIVGGITLAVLVAGLYVSIRNDRKVKSA